jgi:hypothetical protein
MCGWINEQLQNFLVAKSEELICIHKCFMEVYGDATCMSVLLNDE